MNKPLPTDGFWKPLRDAQGTAAKEGACGAMTGKPLSWAVLGTPPMTGSVGKEGPREAHVIPLEGRPRLCRLQGHSCDTPVFPRSPVPAGVGLRTRRGFPPALAAHTAASSPAAPSLPLLGTLTLWALGPDTQSATTQEAEVNATGCSWFGAQTRCVKRLQTQLGHLLCPAAHRMFWCMAPPTSSNSTTPTGCPTYHSGLAPST